MITKTTKTSTWMISSCSPHLQKTLINAIKSCNPTCSICRKLSSIENISILIQPIGHSNYINGLTLCSHRLDMRSVYSLLWSPPIINETSSVCFTSSFPVSLPISPTCSEKNQKEFIISNMRGWVSVFSK